VDFARHSVVAVFAGEKPTSGYSVRVTAIEKDGEACVVGWRVVEPPKDASVAQMISNPYVVVRVDGKCGSVRGR
jgi:hypothetical protein